VSTTLGTVLVLLALGGFAIIGLGARAGRDDLEDYLVARNSQSGGALGLSFLASGLGAWILFSAPEIGAFVGADAVIGYGIAAAAPFLLIALVGPALRRNVPSGHALTEFVRIRFGRAFHAYVVAVFLLYMLVYVTAELTAVGAIGVITAGIPAWIGIVLVALTTLAYTAIGGLPASLRTDGWQAWLVVVLIALGIAAIVATVASPGQAFEASGLIKVDRVGVEAALTLVIAVTAANLFHQGYWQRVWAAEDDRALRRGAVLGGLLSTPIVIAAGLMGVLAIGVGVDLGSPPAPFFALLSSVATPVAAVVLVLGMALVASSVDTLENGLASLVVAERPRLSLTGARVATAVLLVPAVAVALQGYSVLRLFLIADLLATAAVVPMLLVLWPRATTVGVTVGGVAGLVGALGAGLVAAGNDLAGAWGEVTFASGVPRLAPFAWALLASSVVAVSVSLVGRGDRTDLRDQGAKVRVLTTR